MKEKNKKFRKTLTDLIGKPYSQQLETIDSLCENYVSVTKVKDVVLVVFGSNTEIFNKLLEELM